jgi:hypothetical protein
VRSHLLETIWEFLEKSKLKNAELEFLSEYLEVMRPLSLAMDILVGEK